MRWCIVAVVGLTACGGESALLVSVTGDGSADWLDVYVRDDRSKMIVEHSEFSSVVDKAGQPIDITTTPFKIALTLSEPAPVTVLLVGAVGARPSGDVPDPTAQMFWAGRFNVDGMIHVDARLLLVGADDADRDLWPSAAKWPGDSAEAASLYASSPFLLDCDDDTNYDSIGKRAADINPFAVENCRDGIDEDCDGVVAPCVDADGDGDPAGDDCDDNDPQRHHPTTADPYPDPPNCCGYSLGKSVGDPSYYTNFLGQPICPMQRCGDGIDEACQGGDTTCIVDNDCDGYTVADGDCDDNDPNAHPGALEPCNATKDLNCDGVIGCVNCDIDGDGYQRMDPASGCPDATNTKLIDCDDFDTGVHPGQTSELGGAGTEGGGTPAQMVLSALRGNCRQAYDLAGAYPKIAAGTEVAPGDADCNGAAYQGCPSTACDADGDGFQNASCSPPAGQVDCNDNDPTIFPGAPEKCGDGIAQNCQADIACASITDGDGDGYDVSNGDCDDTDASRHPWAVELCDGKDNDCDGLVDEGNPTTAGTPLVSVGSITGCTSSNDGECAKTLGLCVCSIADTKSKYDAGNRTACPTEVMGSFNPKTPQCYFSGQPSLEKCNGLDDLCVGAGFMDGSQECVVGVAPKCCNLASPPNATTGYACIDVSGDVNNCTACNQQCNPTYANACIGSSCQCGTSGAACAANQTWCNGSSCLPCNSDSHCASANCGPCAAGQYCDTSGATPTCITQQGNGGPCTTNSQCSMAGSMCVNGVCCGVGCGAMCQICNPSNFTNCQTAPSGVTGVMCNGPGQACNGQVGAGSCKLALGQACTVDGAGGDCASGHCVSDGTATGKVCCTNDCGGSVCAYCAAPYTSCGTIVGAGQQTVTCTGSSACDGINSGGADCVKLNGQPCTMANQCLSGKCVSDGTATGLVCCGGACAGTCGICATPYTSCASSPGADVSIATCAAAAHFACDGAGGATSDCKFGDGQSCAANTQCASGICASHCCQKGTALACSGTNNTFCDGAGNIATGHCNGQTSLCANNNCVACVTDSDCTASYCDNTNSCHLAHLSGAACNSTTDCAVGNSNCKECVSGASHVACSGAPGNCP